MEITKELLHELFEYKEGELYWKVYTSSKTKPGDKAGCKNSHGYIQISIKKKLYQAHRIIFFMHNGYFPKYVDHIDGNRLNNRIENLRKATNFENSWNSKIRKNNTSGIKGVNWNKSRKKWEVRLRFAVTGKNLYFGRYVDKELAELVAIEARNKYHGEFANHGKQDEKVST